MGFKRVVVLFMSLTIFFVPLSLWAGETPSVKGAYTLVPGKAFEFDGKTVEVMEFLSFYCHTCYNFEGAIPVIKGNFPKKIKWKIIPIYWGKGSPRPGEAYLLAEDAGKGEEMKRALFKAQMVDNKDIGDLKVLEKIAVEIGLGFDFSKRLRAGEKAKDAQMALGMASAFSVNETPSLVIAGNIMTDPHSVEHNIDAFRDNVITIIKSILQSP